MKTTLYYKSIHKVVGNYFTFGSKDGLYDVHVSTYDDHYELTTLGVTLDAYEKFNEERRKIMDALYDAIALHDHDKKYTSEEVLRMISVQYYDGRGTWADPDVNEPSEEYLDNDARFFSETT